MSINNKVRITDELNLEDSRIAASAKAIKTVNDLVTINKEKLLYKADLVDGKIPLDQIPQLKYDPAASGVTTGSGIEYDLTTEEPFELADGILVRFQIHEDSGDNATLNINDTGAKPILLAPNVPFSIGNKAGLWFIAVYNESYDAYIIQWAQKHQHSSDDILYNNSSLTSKLDVLDESMTIITVGKSGQTITINPSSEKISDWILVDGYWGGSYISTGGAVS